MRFAGPNVTAWWAETGTAGNGEGCNKPFWLKDDAVAYVRKHGGYVKPLFESPLLLGGAATRAQASAPNEAEDRQALRASRTPLGETPDPPSVSEAGGDE